MLNYLGIDTIRSCSVLVILTTLISLGCNNAKPFKEKETSDLKIKIDSIAENYIRNGKVKGLSIAIVKQDSILYNNSFGYVDSLNAVPTTNGHYFLMASISKLVGATIVMKLVEEGTLDLDDKLSDLLPDYPNKKQAEKIKLRHLISMTSGLKEYATTIDSIYVATGKKPSKQDYYKFLSSRELEFEPGSHYKYVNSGFVLMAMIVERVTKKSYQSNINRIINKPTGFNIELIATRMENPMMSQHFQLKNGNISSRKHWPWIKGDGGMTNTAIQLAKYPSKWMDESIITKSSFEQMISSTHLSSGYLSEYGLGVKNGDFEGEPMFGHSGGDATTYSMMFHFPKKSTTIVTMVNTNNTPANARQIFSETALVVLDKRNPDFSKSALSLQNTSQFLGGYQIPGDSKNQTAFIVKDDVDQHLYYTFDQNSKNGQKMYYLVNDEFWIEKWPYDRIRFVRDSSNNVIALKEFYGGYMSRIRPKVVGHNNTYKK